MIVLDEVSKKCADQLSRESLEKRIAEDKKIIDNKSPRKWCAICGKWGDHKSGNCPERDGV